MTGSLYPHLGGAALDSRLYTVHSKFPRGPVSGTHGLHENGEIGLSLSTVKEGAVSASQG